MSVASRRPRGHAARALEEALGAVAAPAVRDAILGSALSRAGLVAVPDDATALDAFVRGDFRSAIAERLDAESADAVLGELAPLLAMLASRVRPPSPRPRPVGALVPRPTPLRPASPTARPRPPDDDDASGVMIVGKTVRAGASLSVLVVVTRDTAKARALAVQLTGKTVVRPVTEILDMTEAIEDHRGELPVVLFDCAAPPFHLESVATFASELPTGSWLALLDGTPEDERTARSFAGSTLTVARLSTRDGLEAVARRCQTLLD